MSLVAVPQKSVEGIARLIGELPQGLHGSRGFSLSLNAHRVTSHSPYRPQRSTFSSAISTLPFRTFTARKVLVTPQPTLRTAPAGRGRWRMLIVLFLLTLLPGHASLTGTWAMDRVRSDLGRADSPRQFALQIEQTGNHLTATIFNADTTGQRVSDRECRVEAQPSGSLSCLMPDGADEKWEVTSANELTITRVIMAKSQSVRQRLVLARSALLE